LKVQLQRRGEVSCILDLCKPQRHGGTHPKVAAALLTDCSPYLLSPLRVCVYMCVCVRVYVCVGEGVLCDVCAFVDFG